MVSHTTWIVFAHLVYLIQMAKVMRMNLHNGDKTIQQPEPLLSVSQRQLCENRYNASPMQRREVRGIIIGVEKGELAKTSLSMISGIRGKDT